MGIQAAGSAAFHEAGHYQTKPGGLAYRKILAHYLNQRIRPDDSILEIGCGDGTLLGLLNGNAKTGLDPSARQVAAAKARIPSANLVEADGETHPHHQTYDTIIVADTLNHCSDAQALLENTLAASEPGTRLVISVYNTLWRPILAILTALGLRSKQPKLNWLSGSDVANLLELAGWEVIEQDARILIPTHIPLITELLNRWIAPFLSPLCLAVILIARPRPTLKPQPLSVSVVVPARNEAGNIPAIVDRLPDMGTWTELIFVEGNSTDHTWAAIQDIQSKHPNRRIKIAQQPGKGKGDAVRTGFALAEGDILMILDADLTVPPEDLPKFHAAVASGICEFANGCRLVYPMEDRAMRFLNLCANKLFGLLFSWLLGQPVKDTLCGTKVLSRKHYDAVAANRAFFGDFDPFGDFDLLFGADRLDLKIRDIPVRYRERTYGETNIHRFRHGILLFRMVGFAARKLKFI